MINRIYGDIDQKLQDLKGKKIKIKRVKKPGMAESIYVDRNQEVENNNDRIEDIDFSRDIGASEYQRGLDTFDNSHVISQQKERVQKKEKNQMFYSTAQDLTGRGNQLGEQVRTNIKNFDKSQDQMRQSIMSTFLDNRDSDIFDKKVKILTEDPRIKNKRENPLFYSTNQQIQGEISQIVNNRDNQKKEDLGRFVLGYNIRKVMENEDINIKEIQKHIDKEKTRINQDLDEMVQDLIKMFDQTRAELHGKMDDYLTQYIRNYENLKNRVKKHKQKYLLEQKGDRIKVEINKVSYFGKEPKDYEQLIKFKDEATKIHCSINNCDKEVDKKLLNHLANELSKQQKHVPEYNNTKTQIQLQKESRNSIYNYVADKLSQYCHLIFISPYSDFATYIAQSQIKPIMTQDRQSILYNTNQQLNLQTVSKQKTNHKSKISCIVPINNDNIAVGGVDGTIKIWTIKMNKQIGLLEQFHQSTVSTLGLVRLYASQLKDANNNVLKKMLQEQNEKQQQYLVSGGLTDKQIIVWDLSSYQALKIFQGHQQQITSVISLRDKQNIASCSKDGSWCVWNLLAKDNPRKKRFIDHQEGINQMILSKQKKWIISVGQDGFINVYQNDYQFNIQQQQNVWNDCELKTQIEDDCSIETVNSSVLYEDVIFTGGDDMMIKIWDIEKGNKMKQISGHKSNVIQMIVLEDPLQQIDHFYSIISLGRNEQHLRMSNASQQVNSAIMNDQSLCMDDQMQTGPLMGFIQEQEQIQIIITDQQDNQQYQQFCVFRI